MQKRNKLRRKGGGESGPAKGEAIKDEKRKRGREENREIPEFISFWGEAKKVASGKNNSGYWGCKGNERSLRGQRMGGGDCKQNWNVTTVIRQKAAQRAFDR